ncbi:MAG TPA: four helix bundle protein [Bacteroidia bacterium]|jgi:four helix bundle protein
MATFKKFEDIEAWQIVRKLCCDMDALIQDGIFGNRFRLIGQIEGSSGSMTYNVAEGFGRESRLEFIQFLGFAQGSAKELKSQLYRSYDFKCISEEQFNDFYSRCDLFSKKISKLSSYLNQTSIRDERFKNRVN